MKLISINGLEVEVLRKNNKNMYLRVLPPEGKVRVSAPRRTSEAVVRSFILSKMAWIEGQIQRQRRYTPVANPQYVSGETHYLWGEPYILERRDNTQDRRNLLSRQGERLILELTGPATAEQCAVLLNNWYRRELKNQIPDLMAFYQEKMGVRANSWQIKNMRTKWGTCNITDRRIWLNLQLAKKPPECLEYIIVHELCHLMEKRHSPVFKALLDRYFSAWREAELLL
jgi:predicted metal-dependent hydrolase